MSDRYADFRDTSDKSDKLDQLAKLAQELKRAKQSVNEREKELAKAQALVRNLEERAIPALMQSIPMKEFTTEDGFTIKLDEVIRASIPKARMRRAFKWLEDNGHAGAIKNECKLTFRMGEQEKVQRFLDLMEEHGHMTRLKQKEFIEPSTLRAIVTSALKEGAAIDHSDFGIFRQTVAKTS